MLISSIYNIADRAPSVTLTSDECVVDDRGYVIQEVEVGDGAVDVIICEGRPTGLQGTKDRSTCTKDRST
jgi:hypothetical protein